MNSVVTVCLLVVVMFLGGCAAAVIPETSTDTSTTTSSTKSTDLPSVPYVAASMAKVSCKQKDVCADVLHSSIDQVECVEEVCRCLYNHVYENGTCLRKIENGEDDNKMAEEGIQKVESSTSSPDKTTSERTEPADESTGEMPKTTEERDARLNAMESESPLTTMSHPTMGHSSTTIGQSSTTMGQPTSMTTPPSNEELREATLSNVDKEETTLQSNDNKDSMQGDQPVEMAKSTEMPKVGLLQNCTSSLQCDHADASCIDGSCECKEGYVINPARDRCLRVASRVSDLCEEDIQCIGKLSDFSYCKNKMCVCKEGTIETGVVCSAPKGLGEPCMAISDCLLGMTCDTGRCVCGQGSQPSDDKKKCIGNAASSTLASLVVLCLGLFSILQLRRYT